MSESEAKGLIALLERDGYLAYALGATDDDSWEVIVTGSRALTAPGPTNQVAAVTRFGGPSLRLIPTTKPEAKAAHE